MFENSKEHLKLPRIQSKASMHENDILHDMIFFNHLKNQI